MKSNTFNYSLLAVGVAALMGVSTGANADTVTLPDNTDKINNQATASYTVGTVAQTTVVKSNIVTINVTEQASFSLTAQNDDESGDGDDINSGLEVTPNDVITFTHRLTNDGNFTDTYELNLNQLTTDDTDYAESSAITVTVFDETDPNTAVSTENYTIADFNGNNIVLEADQYATISIAAQTDGNIGGDTQAFTLSAESSYFVNENASGETTATNTSDSVTVLPVFRIVKRVADTLNLSDNTDTATYTIAVTNASDTDIAYGRDATGVTITDTLPTGLDIVTGTVSATGGAGTQNIATTDNSFTITNVNLAQGETITITFQAEANGETIPDRSNIINHATVTDTIGPVTVVDSTDPDATQSPYTNDDENDITGTDSTDAGYDSTQPLIVNERALSLTGQDDLEVPETSDTAAQAEHTATINNLGAEVEGDEVGELTFTITENDAATNVAVEGDVTITYDGVTEVITATSGVYDIYSVFPNGIASTKTAEIKYNVRSTNAIAGETETTTVQLIPGGTDEPVENNGNFTIADTTDVQDITLVKTQALDADCDSTEDVTGSFTQNDINATPGQCVIYDVAAVSNFTLLDVDEVVISDEVAQFTTNATIKNTGNATNYTAGDTNITRTITSLAPNTSESLRFTIQINPNGQANP